MNQIRHRVLIEMSPTYAHICLPCRSQNNTDHHQCSERDRTPACAPDLPPKHQYLLHVDDDGRYLSVWRRHTQKCVSNKKEYQLGRIDMLICMTPMWRCDDDVIVAAHCCCLSVASSRVFTLADGRWTTDDDEGTQLRIYLWHFDCLSVRRRHRADHTTRSVYLIKIELCVCGAAVCKI